MKKIILLFFTASFLLMGMMSCASQSSSPTPSVAASLPTAQTKTRPNAGNWDRLQLVSTAKLTEMQNKTSDPIEKGWTQLAILTKQKNMSTRELANKLIIWRATYPRHPGNALFPANPTLNQLAFAEAPQHIAVLLPQSGPFAASAQRVREGFLNAYYARLPNNSKQTIKFYDTTKTEKIATLYQQAIANGADFIIGPLVKENVQQLSVSGPLSTPTLALNYTNQPSRPDNLYEFGLLPEDEARQLADRAYEGGRRQALLIAPQNAWGERLASAFMARWKANGGTVSDSWYYTDPLNFNKDVAHLLRVNLTTDKRLMHKDNNKDILAQQRRQDVDVIFLFAQPKEARLIVPLLRYYYAGSLPVYATSSTYSGKSQLEGDLNGVIVCDIPRKNAAPSDRLYAMGQDAYMLSQSLQRLQNLPHFSIYGTTGALRLSTTQQIHRRLPCTAIRHGRI